MTALAYHDVVDPATADASGFPGTLAGRYKLSPGDFEGHLDAIAESRNSALLTFDDGGSSSIEIAIAIESRGWRGCFFIVTSLLGTDGFISPDQAVELERRGHTVGSHSHTHPTYMARLSPAELEREWSESRARLAEILGQEPKIASVPGGFYSDQVAQAAASAGYSTLYTSTPTNRRRQVGSIEVVGRYAVWSSTPASTVAAYTRRGSWARIRLELEWKAKTAAKSVSPGFYDKLRRIRAGA